MKWKKSAGAALLTMILAIADMRVLAAEPVSVGKETFSLSEMEQMDVNVTDGIIASGKDGNIIWVIDADGKLTVEGTGDLSGNHLSQEFAWRPYCSQITSAEVRVRGMTDASGLFDDCSNMTRVNLDNFDTSSVRKMGHMFAGCDSLSSVDVRGFDTSNVTDMSTMFMACQNLNSVDVSGFDTSKVTNMGGMFSGCISLNSVDVSGFDTSNVTDMWAMFEGCRILSFACIQ